MLWMPIDVADVRSNLAISPTLERRPVAGSTLDRLPVSIGTGAIPVLGSKLT